MVRHRYTNLDPTHRPHGPAAIARWGILDRLRGRRPVSPPGKPVPIVEPELHLILEQDGRPRLTWIGHASFLGSIGGVHFLIDPVLSTRAGLLYPRFVAPGLSQSDLPEIAAVMVTHNHYDHLDSTAIRGLAPQVPVIAPLGMGPWFARRGRRHVVELEWWESATIGDLRVTLVPSCHWSRRGIFDTNRVLWGGYVVESGDCRLYHAGDTAWFDGFAEIGRRHPDLLAVMLPIGGYRPAWFMEHYHLNPEQAGRAFVELGARHLVPMHWGVFKLTDEPLSEPAVRMRAWWDREALGDGRQLHVMAVGETVIL